LARIQGYLPSGLKQIYAAFGKEVRFTVVAKGKYGLGGDNAA
jgi:hypothetical protein